MSLSLKKNTPITYKPLALASAQLVTGDPLASGKGGHSELRLLTWGEVMGPSSPRGWGRGPVWAAAHTGGY